MKQSRSGFARWLSDNWLELVLVAAFLAALVWILQVGRGLWAIATAEPTATPTARPLVEGRATAAPTPTPSPAAIQGFTGEGAQTLLGTLMAPGPRPVGAPAHDAARTAIADELQRAGWQVEEQAVDVGGIGLRTVVAKAGSGPLVVLATHYDTPPLADLDPVDANRTLPGPGANDGTSSAGVLLELARTLDLTALQTEVWLVFFDGHYAPGGGEPVSAGAAAFAESLPAQPLPQAVVLLDFVGAPEQRFYIDGNSDPALGQALWSSAQQLGFGEWFVPEIRGATDTGALALRQRGVPVVHVMGLDYPHRRTTADTADKVDSASLERIGRLLQNLVTTPAP
jgi:hypothetical protein